VLGSFVWSVLVVCYVAYAFGLLPERSQRAIMTPGCSPSRPSPFVVETKRNRAYSLFSNGLGQPLGQFPFISRFTLHFTCCIEVFVVLPPLSFV
jgi:hypothetical protein